MPEAKMLCPKCGVQMNHHADKLVDLTLASAEPDAVASDGGILEEIHTCPNCKNVEVRT